MFGRTHCHHLQGCGHSLGRHYTFHEQQQCGMGRQVLTLLPPKMKSVGFSKIPVNFYHITHCHIPEQLAFFKFFLMQHTAPDGISTDCDADRATDNTFIFHCILYNVSKYNFQLLTFRSRNFTFKF